MVDEYLRVGNLCIQCFGSYETDLYRGIRDDPFQEQPKDLSHRIVLSDLSKGTLRGI